RDFHVTGVQTCALPILLRLQPAGESFQATAVLPVAGAEVALDLSGAIDVAAERKRLTKDLAAAEKEKAQTSAKLSNEAFLTKARSEERRGGKEGSCGVE